MGNLKRWREVFAGKADGREDGLAGGDGPFGQRERLGKSGVARTEGFGGERLFERRQPPGEGVWARRGVSGWRGVGRKRGVSGQVGLVGLWGGMGLAVWMGVVGSGELGRAMESMPEGSAPLETQPRDVKPREVEVSDLGSNSALPEALRPVYFPVPPDFAERTPVGDRFAGRRLEAGGGGGVEAMPALGYPINQAPIEISAFGMRFSEARAAWRMHTGIDLIVTEGTPVLAAAAGRVVLVDEVSGYGLTVLVDHGNGWQTLYAHLFEIAVQPGEQVQRGQPLGRVGESGRASTPHLHFEIRQRRGERLVALDPAPILRPREPGALVRRP